MKIKVNYIPCFNHNVSNYQAQFSRINSVLHLILKIWNQQKYICVLFSWKYSDMLIYHFVQFPCQTWWNSFCLGYVSLYNASWLRRHQLWMSYDSIPFPPNIRIFCLGVYWTRIMIKRKIHRVLINTKSICKYHNIII